VGKSSTPGPQQKRLAAYLDGLAQAAGHADRIEPLKSYCKGLLLTGERKSVEPMAARLAPDNVGRMHQSLHHLVADAPWSDEEMLAQIRSSVLPAMQQQGPVVAWIVDDTGFPKKGTHSVGVARQYCGQLGKQDNCQVAVSLSVATWNSSLPIAYRLYLPEEWSKNSERRKTTGVPEEIRFQTKPQIALDQIRQAVEADLARGIVLADAAYGGNGPFRAGVTQLGLQYAVGVQSSMTVWEPGAKPWKGQGTSAPVAAARQSTSARLGETVGAGAASLRLEGCHVARRYGAELALTLCRCAGAPCRGRPPESGTVCRRVVAHRVAARRSRAHQILVIDAAVAH
jgi:SRSO17 transposase